MDAKQIRALRKLFDATDAWGWDWPTLCAIRPGVVAAWKRIKAQYK